MNSEPVDDLEPFPTSLFFICLALAVAAIALVIIYSARIRAEQKTCPECHGKGVVLAHLRVENPSFLS